MLSKFWRSCVSTVRQLRSYKQDPFQSPKKGTAAHRAIAEQKVVEQNVKRRVEKATKELNITTPKVITILMIGSTVPQFYGTYQLFRNPDSPIEEINWTRRCIDWINITNTFFAACYFGLDVVRYSDRKSLVKMLHLDRRYALLLLPVAVCLGSMSFSQDIDRWRVGPTVAADLSILALEGKFTAEGMIPYWYFHSRYRMHIFSIINLGIIYWSLNSQIKDIQNNPEKYLSAGESLAA